MAAMMNSSYYDRCGMVECFSARASFINATETTTQRRGLRDRSFGDLRPVLSSRDSILVSFSIIS
eukprot:scaffold107_cov154-Amphora_coffeaeformis.AAC.6